jgi:restriction endonuclease Mrr
MAGDPSFHFPPDLFAAVKDAVPLLTRSKRDVLVFFEGCGVDRAILRPVRERLARDSTISKYVIADDIIVELNRQGDEGLGARRRVLQRISEFDEFSSCYADNVLKAKGAVAAVAQLINKKDSFTRLQEEHQRDEAAHRAKRRAEADAQLARRAELDSVKSDLFGLFSTQDPHQRGKVLESVLNRLFALEDVAVREAFVVVGHDGAGTVEQIDGAIELDGTLYVVEMKWWSARLGRAEVAPHLVSVFGRAGAGGIHISNSGYSPAAIEDYERALGHSTVVLVELEEIVQALTIGASVAELLRAKLKNAVLDRRPLTHPLQET